MVTDGFRRCRFLYFYFDAGDDSNLVQICEDDVGNVLV